MTTIYRRYVDDPTTSEHDLHARSGQPVTVIRPLNVPEELDAQSVGMFKIRFADGFEADAFEDELHEESEA